MKVLKMSASERESQSEWEKAHTMVSELRGKDTIVFRAIDGHYKDMVIAIDRKTFLETKPNDRDKVVLYHAASFEGLINEVASVVKHTPSFIKVI